MPLIHMRLVVLQERKRSFYDLEIGEYFITIIDFEVYKHLYGSDLYIDFFYRMFIKRKITGRRYMNVQGNVCKFHRSQEEECLLYRCILSTHLHKDDKRRIEK